MHLKSIRSTVVTLSLAVVINVPAWADCSWAPAASVPVNQNLFETVVVNGSYITVGENGTILTSSDAQTWQEVYAHSGIRLKHVEWHNNQYVAVGGNTSTAKGAIFTSTDGFNWDELTLPSNVLALDGLAYNGVTYVAVGYRGIIATSPDGVNWTRQVSPTQNYLTDVVWDGQRFVAVGYVATVLTSPDGLNWTRQSPPFAGSSYSFYALASQAGTLMGAVQRDASGQDSLPTSNDSGATWSYGSLTISDIYDVSSDGVNFYAVGLGGHIYSGLQGAMVLETSGTTQTLYGVMSNGTTAVAVGRYGTIRVGTCLP